MKEEDKKVIKKNTVLEVQNLKHILIIKDQKKESKDG